MRNRGPNFKAISHYQDALEIYPHRTNEALFRLLSHYAAAGAFEDFEALKNRFFEERQPPRRVKKLEERLKTQRRPKTPNNLD